jgi:HSP20 family protein
MTLGFWEPFRELDTIDRVVGNLFGRDARDAWERAQSSRTHRLAADLASDKDGYVFRFDVPGVPKDAISISMEDNVLTVSGERAESFAGNNDESTVYRREIVSGQFERSFRLPDDADKEKVTASYTDGVLEVRVGRAEAAQPRKIAISS